MPRSMTYKANSIIYFRGDVNEKIFILKSGVVDLASEDIETGMEMHDAIQTGEFFGVKSAMGKYPREENAVVLQDAEVLVFTVPEFEQLVSQNTRIVIKMLKVFSNQLRRIHKRVQMLLTTDEPTDPEYGLFGVGEYYLKKKMYAQALYVFRRYLTYYPSGKKAAEAVQYIEASEQYAQKYGQGKGPSIVAGGGAQAGAPGSTGGGQELAKPAPKTAASQSPNTKAYYDALSLFTQTNYTEAFKAFKVIADKPGEDEYSVKASFDMGKCMFFLKQYDACIKQFTGLIAKYPKTPDLSDVLYHVGQAWELKGDKEKAKGFYKKIVSMGGEDDPAIRKAKKSLRALEGGA